MATVNLGRIKPVFRGAYSGSTAYVVDDIVTHGNESFICIQAHGAGTQATSQGSYWTKLAAKGTDGTDVGTTITTQGDILYRDGSGLQRLAKGTASQVLKMNTAANAPEWGTLASNVEVITSANLDSTGVAAIEQSLDWATNTDWLYVQIDLLYRGNATQTNQTIFGYLRNASGNITSGYSLQGYGAYRRTNGNENTLSASNTTAFGNSYLDINGWGTTNDFPQFSSVKLYRPLPSNQQFCEQIYWNADGSNPKYHVYYHRAGYNNDTSTKTGVRYEAQNSAMMTEGYYSIRAFKK